MIDYKAQGKANRKKGAAFEVKTRKHLESKGYVVCKWQNNVDLDNSCMIKAKQKFIGGRGMGLGSGFPDFIAFEKINRSRQNYYKLLFIECKTNGKLSVIEKKKMQWLTNEGHECWTCYNDEGKVKFRKFVEYKERNKIRRNIPQY